MQNYNLYGIKSLRRKIEVMDNYDEILDCIFGFAQMINEEGP